MRVAAGLPFPDDPKKSEAHLFSLLASILRLGGNSKNAGELAGKADWLTAELTRRGFSVVQKEGELAPHLLATRGPVATRSTTLLLGHYDTVAPAASGGYTFSQAGGEVEGRTVADMSGGIAVILGALDLLAATGQGADMPLMVLFNSDEERGSASAADLFSEVAPTLERAFVFEGGRGTDGVVLGRKGKVALQATFYGREAHAGINPEAGINALAEAGSVISRLESLAQDQGATLVLGGVTEVSPGVSNTVPGKVNLSGDLRYTTEAVVAPLLADMAELMNETAARTSGVELRVNELVRTGGRPAWTPGAGDRDLFDQLVAVGERLGISLSAHFAGGGSDANNFAALGVPVLDGLGPVGKNFHRADEKIIAATLLERTVLTAGILLAT